MTIFIRTVTNIKYIMNIRLVFGFYHKTKYKRYLIKTMITIFGVLYICFSYLLQDKIPGFALKSIEYISYLFCSLQTEDKYLKEYYRVDVIDRKYLQYIDRKLKIFFSCFFIELIAIHFVFHTFFLFFFCKQCWVESVAIYIVLMRLAIEIGRLPITMTFVLFYYRIKIFNKMFYEEVLSMTTTFDWKKYSKAYVEIVKSLKKTDWPIKFMMIIHLVVGFGLVSMTQFHIASLYKKSVAENYFQILSMIIYLVTYYTRLFIPSIIFELVSEQMDVLKINIANKILTCTNERQMANLHQMLKFLREQPLNYCIWRTVQVDSRLPLGFISLSVTCLVCLLQFTHLLD